MSVLSLTSSAAKPKPGAASRRTVSKTKTKRAAATGQAAARTVDVGVTHSSSAERTVAGPDTLGDEFLAILREDFKAHGKKAIAQCREKDPTTYVKLVASLLPKDVKGGPDELTDDERKDRIQTLIDVLGFAARAAGTPDSPRG
jgi:hypothetical protein